MVRDESLAEETPVALIYNAKSHAVMMATPQDLHDFGLGFSLTEGIVGHCDEVLDVSLRRRSRGIEIALTITDERFAGLGARRRNLVGRTGCGLCGLTSLCDVDRPLRELGHIAAISPQAITRAVGDLPSHQTINRRVHAVHAAAWSTRDGIVSMTREDIGRHNALDKLIGAMARHGIDPTHGFAIITSRCSYEMVQKAVAGGIGILVAVSAPTALAVDVAKAAGVTVIARARGSHYTIHSHPDRVAAQPGHATA